MNGTPRIITVTAKCSDLCHVDVKDIEGTTLAEAHGYVPAFMPGEHYGDYVMIDIDVKTGRILNWKVPSKAQIARDIKNM